MNEKRKKIESQMISFFGRLILSPMNIHIYLSNICLNSQFVINRIYAPFLKYIL